MTVIDDRPVVDDAVALLDLTQDAGPLLDLSADATTGYRPPQRELRVAIVHDYLTQRGGAERVVLAMSRAFPGAVVHTSMYEPKGTYADFQRVAVRTTPLQRVGLLRRHHRAALPFLRSAMEGIDVGDVDVVLVSSSGWAHGVRTDAPVVVYCHNTPRWLHQVDDYCRGLRWPSRLLLRLLGPALRRWDAASAARAHTYLANGSPVRERVRRVYGRSAQVLAPPVSLDPDGAREPVPALRPGFLLTVGRPRGYKNTAVVARAVAMLPDEHLVTLGWRPCRDECPPNVTALEGVSDAQLRWLYDNAAALVGVSHEDFGLTPVEANRFGVPSLVLRRGGYLDTTAEGVSGLFVDEATPEAVAAGVRRLRARPWDPAAIRAHAHRFSEEAFAAQLRAVVRSAARVAG